MKETTKRKGAKAKKVRIKGRRNEPIRKYERDDERTLSRKRKKEKCEKEEGKRGSEEDKRHMDQSVRQENMKRQVRKGRHEEKRLRGKGRKNIGVLEDVYGNSSRCKQ